MLPVVSSDNNYRRRRGFFNNTQVTCVGAHVMEFAML